MGHDTSTAKPIIKAASACVWRRDEVLLVQRGKAFGRGFWSLPGGRIEPGETAVEAAVRELLEETGITAQLDYLAGDFELEGPRARYIISCWTGRYVAGVAGARSDVLAVQWLDHRHIATLKLAPNTAEAIAQAQLFVAN